MGMFAELHKLDQAQTTGSDTPATVSTVPQTRPGGPVPAPPAALRSAASTTRLPAHPAPQPPRPAPIHADLTLPQPTAAEGPAPAAPPVAAPPALDLRELPYRKATFLFSDAEFEALEDLKLRLRREFDLPAAKNDLARCAIAYLVADVARQGATSPVLLPLTRRHDR